jgi:hypothetical protein
LYTKKADPKISHLLLSQNCIDPATSVEKPRHEILLTNTAALSRRLLPLPSFDSGALIIAGRSALLSIAQVLFGATNSLSLLTTKK